MVPTTLDTLDKYRLVGRYQMTVATLRKEHPLPSSTPEYHSDPCLEGVTPLIGQAKTVKARNPIGSLQSFSECATAA